MSETPGDAVPASQRGSWSSFLKSIASFSGDLSSLTAPPFILSPTSLTEFPAYWCERPQLFAAIAEAPAGEERALAVLRWFISTLKDQYTSRNETMGSEKKPLNPVLGELFYGKWPATQTRGQTNLAVEQVSHHPPITAYLITNTTQDLELLGHNAQKTTFSSGSIIVRQIGHAILRVKDEEEYLITLPKLRIDGVWYGSPYIELTDTSYIISKSHISIIEYKGKGYFSGKSHQFKASLCPAPSAPPPSLTSTPVLDASSSTSSFSSLYTSSLSSSSSSASSGFAPPFHVIDGLWHQTSKFSSGPRKGQPFHDVTKDKEHVTVVGGDGNGGMGEYETRRLWGDVAKGIRTGDFESASVAKTKIENDQRQKRKDEQANGTKWQHKHFRKIESDPVYAKLAPLAKLNPSTEDAWVFEGHTWPENAH